MGYSPTKKPFDLKEFLSQKASPSSVRWGGSRWRGAQQVADDQADSDKEPSASDLKGSDS